MGEAIVYLRRQWKALVRYVEDGDLAIDNNASERALRAVAVGRKNWMFAGSNEGGRRAAILYSLIGILISDVLYAFVDPRIRLD